MKTKIEPIVFYVLLLSWLLPIWTVDFLVTGDGPCHLYNSKILSDWMHHLNRDFYDPFYFLNTNFEPNWFANLFMTGAMQVFSPPVAEKLFLTFCILGFCLGFRAILKFLSPESVFLSSLALLFAWHRLLMMGFYNNSASLALWFLVVAAWLRVQDRQSPFKWLLMGVLFLVLFLAHPMGFTFAGLMCGSLLIGWFLYEWKSENWRFSLDNLVKRVGTLGLITLPALVLFAEFMLRRDWSSAPPPNIGGVWGSMKDLYPLVTLNSTERDLAKAIAIFCGLTGIFTLVLRVKERVWKKSDGLLLFFAFTLLATFSPPSSISGGLEVSLRLVMMPFLALIFAASTARFPMWFRYLTLVFCSVVVFSLLWVRIPIHRDASEYAKEIVSCNPYISDKARILVLNYDWAGRTPEGNVIANRAWLFNHVDCYLGTYRSAAISDNYEVNYWYFPMIERGQTNFYKQTDKDGVNFDNRPPRANILDYKRRSGGQDIDYVLLLSYRDEFAGHEYTKEIFEQLGQAYEKAFVSEHQRAVLYKRK